VHKAEAGCFASGVGTFSRSIERVFGTSAEYVGGRDSVAALTLPVPRVRSVRLEDEQQRQGEAANVVSEDEVEVIQARPIVVSIDLS
jgi:hypothetical protein